MVAASVCAGLAGLFTWLLDMNNAAFMNSAWVHATLFLLVAIFHSGVRWERKTYPVDMTTQETHSAYVAVSNTVIGIAMLVGEGIGVLADVLITGAVIAILGGVSVVAALYVEKMPEVSGLLVQGYLWDFSVEQNESE